MLLIFISELISYIAFSLLIGFFIVLLVPADMKPPIQVPKKILILIATIIPAVSYIPLIPIVHVFSRNTGYAEAFLNVVLSSEMGQTWLVTLILAAVMIGLLMVRNFETNKMYISLALMLLIAALALSTVSTHAGAIGWQGYIFQTLHYLAVAAWLGILSVVSWFAKSKTNWKQFLEWFTPVAIACLIIVVASGFFIMETNLQSYENTNTTVIHEYGNSLAVNYGQALLIKHLFMFAVLAFAVINSILFRKKHSDSSFNPLKWARIETCFAFIVFASTAVLSHSTTPHEISRLLASEGVSPLFQTFYGGETLEQFENNLTDGFQLELSFNIESYALFGMSLLLLIGTLLAAGKMQSPIAASFSAILMAIFAYLGVMLGIQ